MTEVTPALIKGLFHHLVKEVGGVEASGAFLGVSAQRVSQLQNPKTDDLPTIMHVCTLQAVIGQAIVTDELSRAVTGGRNVGQALDELHDVHAAAVGVRTALQNGASRKEVEASIFKLRGEVDDVAEAANAA